MLLIFPPAAKGCEPPAGIARLAGALRQNGIPCQTLDANLEGLLWLLAQPVSGADTWTRRAAGKSAEHLAALRDPGICGAPGRYRRAVSDLNRLAAISSRHYDAVAGLADFRHCRLSPLRSADLLDAAGHPGENPYFPWFSRRLEGIMASRPFRMAGFSLNYLSQAITAFAMIGFLRQRFPDVGIVLGGGLVTSWMKRPGWRNPFQGLVDRLVAGPGELPLLELCGRAPAEGRLPLPDFESLPLGDYLSPGLVLPYSGASGCWWNRCSFCPERAEGNEYRPVPAAEAMSDLRRLTERHRPALLHLTDNAVSPALLRKLAEASPGGPWYGFARIGGDLEDPDFCLALRRCGCVMLKLGLESGDQAVLDRLDKGIDLESASRVLANLKRAGIAVYLYLLFGTPAETEAAARKTLEFTLRHHESIRFLNLAIFNMPLCNDASGCETGSFYEGDLSLYTSFRHPAGWDRKAVRLFLDREFSRHPAVAGILRNDPPLFTSNHAPFFAGEGGEFPFAAGGNGGMVAGNQARRTGE